MLALIAALLLFLTAAALGAARLLRASVGVRWLVAALGCLLAWSLALAARMQIPAQIIQVNWQPAVNTAAGALPPLTLILDEISWRYAAALTTLATVVILTVAARPGATNWRAWAGTLILAGLGALAVLAGNVLTLLLCWAALDLAELFILLTQIRQPSVSQGAALAFAARSGGVFLLAVVVIPGGGMLAALPDWEHLPAAAGLYVLLAVTLRMGVAPLHLPFSQEPLIRRGLGTSLRLAPATASLALLTRAAAAGSIAADWAGVLTGLAGISALYGALQWALAADEMNGRPFWVLSLASFASAAAVLAQPQAVMAWVLAMLLGGTNIFLYTARRRRLALLPWLSGVCISALPLTPTWPAAATLGRFAPAFMMLFLAAHALLLFGYARHLLRPAAWLDATQRWAWFVYPLGLALLPGVWFFVQAPLAWQIGGLEGLQQGWAGAASLGAAGLLALLARSHWRPPRALVGALERFFSLAWLSGPLLLLYRLVEKFLALLSHLIEGEGGLLWVLVALALGASFLLGGR